MRIGLIGAGDKVCEVFESTAEAADEFGVKPSTIERAVKMGRKIKQKYLLVRLKDKERKEQ